MVNLILTFLIIFSTNIPYMDRDTITKRDKFWNMGVKIHNENPKKAIELYKKGINISPHPYLYTNIADCYVKLKDYKNGELYYKKAEPTLFSLKKYSYFPYYTYGKFLFDYKKDYKKAKIYIDEAKKLYSNKKDKTYKEIEELSLKISNEIEKGKIKSKGTTLKMISSDNDKNIQSNIDEVLTKESNKDSEEIINDDDGFGSDFINKKDLKIEDSFNPSTTFRGFMKNSFFQDRLIENGLEDITEWRMELFLELKHQFTKNISIMLSSTLFRSATVERNEDDSIYWISNGENYRAFYEYQLEESYIDYKKGNITLRAGQQIFKWGENIGFSRSDIVNRSDYRFSIIPDIDKRKIPVLAIDGGFTFKNSKIDLIWLPVRYDSKYSLFGRDFSLIQPTKEIDPSIIDNFLDKDLQDRYQTLPAVTDDYPQISFKKSLLALNFSSKIGGLNYSLMLYYGYQELPEMDIDNDLKIFFMELLSPERSQSELTTLGAELSRRYLMGEDLFKSKYTRYFQTSFSASYIIESVILKFDFAYSPKRLYYTSLSTSRANRDQDDVVENSFKPIYRSVVDYTLGFEYQYKVDKFIFDFEIYGTNMRDDDGENYFYDKSRRMGVFSFIKWKIDPDRWDLLILGNYNMFFKDYLASLRLTYKFNKKRHLTLGYDHFGGDFDSPIGRFDKNDQLFLVFKRFF